MDELDEEFLQAFDMPETAENDLYYECIENHEDFYEKIYKKEKEQEKIDVQTIKYDDLLSKPLSVVRGYAKQLKMDASGCKEDLIDEMWPEIMKRRVVKK
jgi:hypothetical protein